MSKLSTEPSRIYIQFEVSEEEKRSWIALADIYAEKSGGRGTVASVVRIASSYGRSILEQELSISNEPFLLNLSRSDAARALANHYLQKSISLINENPST